MTQSLRIANVTGLFILCLSLSLLMPFTVVKAAQFGIGETVFVSFPATNIKDDAFIIGKVTARDAKGDLQIAVIDYVEGHDYGSSCVPISKNENQDQGLGKGWEIWQDTTKLDTQQLEYVVPKEKVLKLEYGRLYFVERNNVFIVFGRWKSDAPMLTLDRMELAIAQAKSAGLPEIEPAFELAKLHRLSYYGDFGRPLMAYESIAPLNTALDSVFKHFKNDSLLEALWRTEQRDWNAIKQSSEHYFLIEAIDKVVRDAQEALYADELDKADAEQVKLLKTNLKQLQR